MLHGDAASCDASLIGSGLAHFACSYHALLQYATTNFSLTLFKSIQQEFLLPLVSQLYARFVDAEVQQNKQ